MLGVRIWICPRGGRGALRDSRTMISITNCLLVCGLGQRDLAEVVIEKEENIPKEENHLREKENHLREKENLEEEENNLVQGKTCGRGGGDGRRSGGGPVRRRPRRRRRRRLLNKNEFY